MNNASVNIPQKCPSGIDGLDVITAGGLPRGRTVLVCGGAGCGKTLLGLQFLVRGAEQHGEPGLLVSFEESEAELVQNAASIGCDLAGLVARGKLRIDCVDLVGAFQAEAGEFDLEGLFIRLEAGIAAIGARRVMIDSIESLFARFSRADLIRVELHRLNRWLKERQVTAVVTGESAGGGLTRYGIEEFLSDSVILLDHRTADQIATRRLRVVKLRGSAHGTNEYPFLIADSGLAVLPITSLGLDYPVSDERLSTGIPRLDAMLDGRGLYRGSSVLVSGTSGTGKTSIGMAFAAAACARGETALVFAFEEAPRQIERNLRSIGIDLAPHVAAGRLHFDAQRATSFGLETHLARMIRKVEALRPDVVVFDPVSNLVGAAPERDVKVALTRLVDYLKNRLVTVLFTDLTRHGLALETTSTELSSLMDTWLLLRDIELGGERNRGLYVLKSRGMRHSNQIREMRISADGIDLIDVYTGPSGVLTGTARVALEAREGAEQAARERQVVQLRLAMEERERQFERQRAELQERLDADLRAMRTSIQEVEDGLAESRSVSSRISALRGRDSA